MHFATVRDGEVFEVVRFLLAFFFELEFEAFFAENAQSLQPMY